MLYKVHFHHHFKCYCLFFTLQLAVNVVYFLLYLQYHYFIVFIIPSKNHILLFVGIGNSPYAFSFVTFLVLFVYLFAPFPSNVIVYVAPIHFLLLVLCFLFHFLYCIIFCYFCISIVPSIKVISTSCWCFGNSLNFLFGHMLLLLLYLYFLCPGLNVIVYLFAVHFANNVTFLLVFEFFLLFFSTLCSTIRQMYNLLFCWCW